MGDYEDGCTCKASGGLNKDGCDYKSYVAYGGVCDEGF